VLIANYLYNKFELSSFTSSRDIKIVPEFKSGSRDLDHTFSSLNFINLCKFRDHALSVVKKYAKTLFVDFNS